MALSRWMWRGMFPVLGTVWAWLMMVVGLLLITSWSARMPGLHGWGVLLGVMLLAGGQFVGAVIAGRLFPRASRRARVGVEAAAWVVIAGLVGVWLLG